MPMQARANASKPNPLVSDAKVLSPLPPSSICSFWVRMSRIGRSLSIEATAVRRRGEALGYLSIGEKQPSAATGNARVIASIFADHAKSPIRAELSADENALCPELSQAGCEAGLLCRKVLSAHDDVPFARSLLAALTV